MIIDEKTIMYSPPPSYAASTSRPRSTLATLPPHLLLQIVYMTFPQSPTSAEGKLERQRKTLLWLASSLRLVSRTFYIACMHVLRSTYLPSYHLQLRAPYTSDPFPTSDLPSYTTSPLTTLQRETLVLDKYIALKVREDVFQDDSELHLERKDAFRDLFDLMQPKSRLEDLVRHYGLREGVVCLSTRSRSGSTKSTPTPSRNGSTATLPPSPSSSRGMASRASAFFSSLKSSQSSSQTKYTPPPPPREITPLPFPLLSITFSPRRVGLVLASPQGRRTIVEVQREGREEKLEVTAKRVVSALRGWLEE